MAGRETVHSSWSEKGGKGLAWAGRAIRRELLEFRFDYPVELVPEAGGKHNLHYYIFSDRLFLDDLEFDQNGVAMKRYRAHGSQYNPLFVAWWGLFNLEQYFREKDDRFLQQFLIQVGWLKVNVVMREDGAAVWPCYFDWQEGLARLTPPWISGMYQGVVISALIRAFRLTGDHDLLALCEKGSRVFGATIAQGGVRTISGGQILYEEYPVYPLPRILDGFLFSLLGLYDLYVQTRDTGVQRLFTEGVQGLLSQLSFWNYRNKWSWYGSHGYLCPPQYHKVNCLLLTVLGNVTGEKALFQLSELWDVKHRSVLDKLEIFLVFTVTKNWARLRLPRD
jgi:heparosan-N-sulfate-glucuronate 5-epimerase